MTRPCISKRIEDPCLPSVRRERRLDPARVKILEAALAAIGRESELVLDDPACAFIATRKIASLVRQVL